MRSVRLQGHTPAMAQQRIVSGVAGVPPTQPGQSSPVAEVTINEADLDKPPREHIWKKWQSWSRRRKIITASSTVLAFGLVIGALLVFFPHKEPLKSTTPIKAAAAKPTTIASPLSGLQVDPSLAARPVTAIMIENSTDARPQSGLQDAGVVFEAIAEGGITRFMALYQDTAPQYVGPVRSLRPYYIDFAAPFQAAIAHVGGSPEALDQVRSGMKDLDQFFNAGAYWRSASRDAPHNVYTSFEKLDALNQTKGYTTSTYAPWPRKKDKPLATPTAGHINVNISSADFNSHYDYDKTSNSYLRSEGGKPHIITVSADDKTGQALRPKVVIALAMTYGIQSDGKHSEYGVTGSGAMSVFQDGGVTHGTWSKADRSSSFVFKDDTGKPLALNPGQAWITAVSDLTKVDSAP
jgi:hypothetical protein